MHSGLTDEGEDGGIHIPVFNFNSGMRYTAAFGKMLVSATVSRNGVAVPMANKGTVMAAEGRQRAGELT